MRRRHVPAAVRPLRTVEDEVRERIRKAGYVAHKILRHYPPKHESDVAEVLFVGHAAQHPAQKPEPLTAWLPQASDGTVIVSDGF